MGWCNNRGMKLNFGILALFTLLFFAGNLVEGSSSSWSEWEDTSSCIASECGTSNGTKNQERSKTIETCDTGCPTVHFEWKEYQDCPEGYKKEGDDKCKKEKDPGKGNIIDRPFVDKSADVVYEKSEDPNKCHRPSDDTLKDVYGMSNDAKGDFKKENEEWKDSIQVNCRTEVVDTETRSVGCDNAEVIACESDPTPTPTPNPDVCANIGGVQTSVPEGLHLDAGKINCVSFSVPGVPESSSTSQVLGTSTSQVLGASTMATTGVATDAIFNSIFTLGSLLTSFGIMRNGKKNS